MSLRHALKPVFVAALSVISLVPLCSRVLYGEELILGSGAACCEEEDIACSYGPPPCHRRGTLFQWSYGTSFSGGPDLSEPLVTDRPDFTESSVTVGLGVVQVETGYTYTFDDTPTENLIEHSIGEPLFRIGMFADWFELRLGVTYLDETTNSPAGRTEASGFSDLYVGAKLALTPQECLLPEMAIIPQMLVPTGDDAFSADEVLPGLNWIYSWEISDCLATAGSTQFNRAIDGTTGEAFIEFAQSWTVALALTDRLGSYAEWFAIVPDGADTERTRQFFNGGFTYLFSNDVQFDVRAGVGLNDAAEDYFIGTGLSVRLY